eukprot:CAMPEP_0119102174 /NCGR_PEP_ID=MMETSP1180-20130426/1012_1 /TAXON_ID=3052 ORGANISM="Chlamydomonas cf sp, Strain CCMP681" /NCGR_SAMPLE_ID=MMETSP1180 /ASSEMBLY_ACC=CAM_ASM_000741 /LENGTH=520 /DNA_ID=CAMNT_0007086417 /DNA_START=67 /DNA_END=1629 /DNA_ORIENTATION=+
MASSVNLAPVDHQKAYEKVADKLRELSALEGIGGLLGWDEMTMLPDGASGSRGAQKAALAGVVFDKRTDAELGALLRQLDSAIKSKEGAPELDEYARATVRDAFKEYTRTVVLPKEMAQRAAILGSEGHQAWVEARKSNDFSKFAPFLQRWVDLNREKAAFIDPSIPAYDVLLDEYEKGMTSARLDEVFIEVREGLKPLIAAIKAKGCKTISEECCMGTFDVDTQAKLCKEVAVDIGFNLECGRLDVSVHPFTGGTHPTDVRMTTRFKPDNVLEGLTGAIHETGHALYEQGRNLKYDGLPVNAAMSMGVHESQSLMWERMVGLSKPFATYLLPKLQAAFPGKFDSVTTEVLYQAFNVVQEPSLVRTESDELTYPMHIIVRYEIEKGLIAGTVKVEDVPRLWTEKMREYLGDVPPTDAQGCLQDVHWSMGAMGYFPTYTLGALYAAQIYQCAMKHLPGLEGQIAAGDFKQLKAWLNEHIHKLGSLYANGDELMTAVTGEPLKPSVFLTYLKEKYSALYGIA